MSKPIAFFRGEKAYLSNFFYAPIVVNGIRFPTNEHAYQYFKITDPEERAAILACETPKEAKQKGYKVTLREDWETRSVELMEMLLRIKFKQHPELMDRLLATENAELVEGNYWHDNRWGVCGCQKCAAKKDQAQNLLGKLLMKIRAEERARRAGLSQ